MKLKSQKKIIIVHGYRSYPTDCWFPWLKRELIKLGFRVIVPRFTNPAQPKMKNWITTIKNVVDIPDEQTYLVGHSLGVIAILRYLETLQEGHGVGGVVSVGGRVIRRPHRKATASFFKTPVPWSKIKRRSKRFVGVYSSNDTVVPIINGRIFKKKLHAKLILENKGHFTREEKIFSLPSLLAVLKKISS